jgi:ubiquitin-conjugating enzyme E2 D/E
MSKRLAKEFADLQANPPTSATVSLRDDNLHEWVVTLTPAAPSIAAELPGAPLALLLSLPPEYPFKPPSMSLSLPLYHPMVDEKGVFCTGILDDLGSTVQGAGATSSVGGGGWTPQCKLRQVIDLVLLSIEHPEGEGAVRPEIAREAATDGAGWRAKARSQLEAASRAATA